MKKKFLPIVLVFVVCLVVGLVGCNTNENKSNEKTVVLAESYDFQGGFASFYDPNSTAKSYSYHYYINNFYETLVEYKDGTISPCLATDWKVSKDGKIYTFNLRKDVKFSDGSKFNAKVVKLYFDNMRTLLAGNNNNGLFDSYVSSVVATDDYTVEFHLNAPYYAALNDLAMAMPRGIMAPSAFKKDGKLNFDILSTKTLGTGPYMYTGENNNNTQYTFVRNPYYYGEKPDADKVIVKIIPEANELALRNGEVDIIVGSDKISTDTFNNMKALNGYDAIVSDINFVTEFISMNPTKAPFNDKNVRLAVNQAIDKDAIVKNLYNGLRTKADTIMSSDLPYCDVEVDPYVCNKEKSKKLLQDAGWIDSNNDGIREKNGVNLEATIKYPSTGNYDKLVLAVQDALGDIGMKINLCPLEMMAFFNDVYGKADFEMTSYISYWIPYDPYIFVANMNPCWMDSSQGAGRFSTDAQVSHALADMPYEEANELINSLLKATTNEEVKRIYSKVLKCAHSSSVLVPIDYMNEFAVYNNSVVKDYKFNSIPNLVDFSLIELK